MAPNVPLLLTGVALFGLGLGNTTSLPPLIVQSDFSAGDTARAVAFVTACSQGCYAFAPGVFGALREGWGGGWLFVVAGLVQLAAAITVLSVRRRVSLVR